MNKLLELQQVDIYVTGREKPVLQGITTEILAGEWLAITGRNGGGKSVLGKLLAGLEGHYSGEITWSSRPQPIRVQWVMQNPESQLIGETVWEDVCLGLENLGRPPEEIVTAASQALRQVGLEQMKERLVHQLSGGQKQLLALAGALAMEPDIIVADEVTSMLDPAGRRRVLEALDILRRRGITIIMITQLLEELVYADRILAIDQGRIVYQGEKESFFYSDELGGAAVCEELGLVPPYTVRTAKALMKQGITIKGCPLTPEELERAVRTG